MIIEKPHEKGSGTSAFIPYSEQIVQAAESLAERMSDAQKEDMIALVDMIYKEGFVDGFLDCAFYARLR